MDAIVTVAARSPAAAALGRDRRRVARARPHGRLGARQSGALRFRRRHPSGQPLAHGDQRARRACRASTICRTASMPRCWWCRSRAVLDAIAACGRRGVGAAIVFASGLCGDRRSRPRRAGEARRGRARRPVSRCSGRTASAFPASRSARRSPSSSMSSARRASARRSSASWRRAARSRPSCAWRSSPRASASRMSSRPATRRT